jgi:hypothetical protein
MLVLLTACYRYRPEVLNSLQTGQVSAGTRVRLTYRESRHKPVEMDLERLDLPYVSGIVYTRGDAPGDRIPHHLRLDLRDIQTIEVQELDGTLSAVAVVSGLAALAALFVVAVTSTLQLSGNGSESR